jgi:rod shape determining protein RodA
MSVFLERAAKPASAGLTAARYLRNVDWTLLLVTFGLAGFGLAMVYSATSNDPNITEPTAYMRSQLVGLVLGSAAMFVISLVDYSRLSRWRNLLYGFALLLLVVTLFAGVERMGARRWLPLPLFDLQTSELAKVLVIVSFAGFLAEGVELRPSLRFVIRAVAYVVLPAALVFLEPDLGTAIVFFAMAAAMLLVWGIRWSHVGVLLAAGLGAVVLVARFVPTVFGVELLKPYQIERLTVFLNPENDSTGAAYQLAQSKIAVASGMFTGKGFGQGTQTMLDFLPAHHTDFIFAVIGEELGFLGAMLLLGLYLLLLWRAFRIASLSKNLFGSLIAAGIAGVLLFQVFVNVGMTIGLMPITGVPLPFVSFGSSSLVVFLMAAGLLQSVHIHSRIAAQGTRVKGDT